MNLIHDTSFFLLTVRNTHDMSPRRLKGGLFSLRTAGCVHWLGGAMVIEEQYELRKLARATEQKELARNDRTLTPNLTVKTESTLMIK
jgi:uncharacterized membrane protein YcfT